MLRCRVQNELAFLHTSAGPEFLKEVMPTELSNTGYDARVT